MPTPLVLFTPTTTSTPLPYTVVRDRKMSFENADRLANSLGLTPQAVALNGIIRAGV